MSRRLGQHFLADRRVLTRMVEKLHLADAPLVMEIGAGRGALTELLAAHAQRVMAIELDPPLAAFLRGKFAGQPHVEIIEGDVLELPLDSLLAHRARVIGNLPYYITSPILLRLFEFARLIDEIAVMVQLEVAERLVATPGSRDYGLLSVTTQYYTRPELLFRIPPGAFRPPPKVDSALVRMPVAPRGAELGITNDARFFRFVRACFQQKRKTLLNNLKGLYNVERVREVLPDPRIRAEDLPLEEFAKLYGLTEHG